VSTRAIVVSTVVCTALVLAAAWAFEWELGRAMVVAPLIVIGLGAAAGVVVLLGKALLESIRGVKRPRLVFGLVAAGVGLLVLLSVLGVELPRE